MECIDLSKVGGHPFLCNFDRDLLMVFDVVFLKILIPIKDVSDSARCSLIAFTVYKKQNQLLFRVVFYTELQ